MKNYKIEYKTMIINGNRWKSTKKQGKSKRNIGNLWQSKEIDANQLKNDKNQWNSIAHHQKLNVYLDEIQCLTMRINGNQ